MTEPTPTTPAGPTPGTPQTTTETNPSVQATPTTTQATPSADPANPGSAPTLLTEGVEPAKEGPKEDEAPKGAPETYADFTAPEGITLDKDAIANYAPMFKELGLTQESAQKVVDAVAKREADMIKRGNDAWHKTNNDWQAAAKSEWGTKLPEMRATIGRAIESAGLTEAQRADFAQAMNLTGAGNNPAFIRMFHALATQITEGKPLAAGGPVAESQKPNGSARPATFGGALYPGGPVSGGPAPVQ